MAEAQKKLDGRGGARPGAGRKPADKADASDYAIFNKARARKAIYDAQLAELDLKERQGALVARDVVEREYAALVRSLRDTMLAYPARVAALVAPTPEQQREVEQIMSREMRITLMGMVNDGGGE